MSSGMEAPHVVTVGSSAGGIQALMQILSALPRDLPAPLLIVQHLSPRFETRLPEILATNTHYPVEIATHGKRIESGHAYIAPPDQHMVVDTIGRIRLRHTAPIRFARPSVDVLFLSVAPIFGERTVAVLLSGGGADGTDGARAVRAHGGVVIAQSQSTSQHFGMPGSAIHAGHVDQVLPLDAIARRIIELTSTRHAHQ